MKRTWFAAFAVLLFLAPTAAFAGQVPTPINAPASVTSGDIVTTTANAQQAADSGINLSSVTANKVLASPASGGAGAASMRTLVSADMPGSGAGSGTLTSVGLSMPTQFTCTGSPITNSGTITCGWNSQSANAFFAGPSGGSGAPTFRAIVGADLPGPGASALGGVQSLSCPSHQWFDLLSTAGVFTCAQPGFADLSGAIAASQLIAPTTSAFGGVYAITCPSHKWIDVIPTSGVQPTCAQPGAADVSGLAASATIDTTNAGNITSGLLAIAEGGTGAATTSQNYVFAGPSSGSGAPAFRALVQADLPTTEDDLNFFGDGSDGSVTVSSGVTTLTRDMFYLNLTISGTGQINTAGFRIYVSGTLDLTAAPAAAIYVAPQTAVSGATAGAWTVEGTIPVGSPGGNSSTGSGLASAAMVVPVIGGVGGPGGAGSVVGNPNADSGGAGGTAAVLARLRTAPMLASLLASKIATAQGVLFAGTGGGGGGGSSTASGGGGAAGGGAIIIQARTINRGGSTATGAIQAKGQAGGNGVNATTGQAGSAGGGGGGGGFIGIICRFLTGSTASTALDTTGGAAGTGGNGFGTSYGGGSGGPGGGGQMVVIDLSTATVTNTMGGAAGVVVPGANTAGGVPAAPTTNQAAL